LFFGVGKHAREDLPLLVDEIRASHPGIEVELLPTAGEYPELTALMANMRSPESWTAEAPARLFSAKQA
jgi:sirohydrochlorin cobaltochelatase